MKLDDEDCLRFEVVGNKDMAANFPVEVEFNRVNVEENMGKSQSKKDRISPPRDSEISGDQDVRASSNTEGSETTSERLDLDLVLGKTSSNSSPECSDISFNRNNTFSR